MVAAPPPTENDGGQPIMTSEARWPSTGLYHGDQIVYVGQTNNLAARLSEHERSQSHWESFDYMSTKGTNTRDRKRIEERAIVYNRPPRNVR